MSKQRNTARPSSVWKLRIDGPADGEYNMVVDEALLNFVSRSASPPATILRFYQWKQPTLSLGFSQKAEKVVDFSFCKLQGIKVVRRPTGGKAVLHDREVTYSVVSNDPDCFPVHDITRTYQLIAKALSAGLRTLGIPTTLAEGRSPNRPNDRKQGFPQFACFALANHYEILWKNRKLIGSAQRRTRRGFLQHGSLLLEFDPSKLAGALGVPQLVSIDSEVATLKRCLGQIPPISEILRNLIGGFAEQFAVVFEEGDWDEWLAGEIESVTAARNSDRAERA